MTINRWLFPFNTLALAGCSYTEPKDKQSPVAAHPEDQPPRMELGTTYVCTAPSRTSVCLTDK